MQIIDNIIILLLVTGSFFMGKRISDGYHRSMIDQLEYQIRLMAAEKGVGYVAPPPRKSDAIGEEFMERLKENGRATTAIRTPRS